MKHIGVMGMLVVAGVALARPGLAVAAPKAPAELIATVARGPSSLDGIRAFVDQIQPGQGSMINDTMIDAGLAQVVGTQSIGAIDHASPMYLLYVDGGGAKGFALVGKVGDPSKLAAGTAQGSGWAVLGSAPVVKKVSAYALSALPAQPAPGGLTATLYVGQALARYHAQIEDGRRAMAGQLAAQGNPMGGFAGDMIDGVMSVLGDADRLVVTVDAGKDGVAIDTALVPRSGTKLAKFVGAQHASDYGLLGKLPAGAAMMVLAGHLESGPYHDGMVALIGKMYGGNVKDLVAIANDVMKASTGEIAMTMSAVPKAGFAFQYLYGVADAKAAARALGQVTGLLAKGITVDAMGTPTTMKAVSTPAHDGVQLTAYDTTYDLDKTPPDRRKALEQMLGGQTAVHAVMGSFDQVGVFTMGKDAVAAAGAGIDAARGKGTRFTPSRSLADELAASRARNDSLFMSMDFGAIAAMMPQASAAKHPTGDLLMTMSFADGSVHFRMAMATDTIRSMKP